MKYVIDNSFLISNSSIILLVIFSSENCDDLIGIGSSGYKIFFSNGVSTSSTSKSTCSLLKLIFFVVSNKMTLSLKVSFSTSMNFGKSRLSINSKSTFTPTSFWL